MSAETMEGRAEPIKLRPHHLKTLWTYMLDKQPINPEEMDKEGYGQGFTDAMYSLFDRIIQEPLTFVEIVPSLDSICANCKRDREKSKCYLKDEDKYFGKNATDVMEHIGCRVGETYHAGDLINRIEKCLLDASVWFRKGFKEAALGRGIEAIENYDIAIRINPDNAGFYYERGLVKEKLGRIWEAIGDYNKAIEIDADYAVVYIHRGHAKRNLGWFEGAIADYSQAIEIAPYDPYLYVSRGIAKKRLGKLHEAIGDYNKAIEIEQVYADAYHNRAFAKLALGDIKGAEEDFAMYDVLTLTGESR